MPVTYVSEANHAMLKQIEEAAAKLARHMQDLGIKRYALVLPEAARVLWSHPFQPGHPPYASYWRNIPVRFR